MQQPRYWRKLERHPLSVEYEDVDSEVAAQAAADLKRHGNLTKRCIWLYEGQVLDGWQFQLWHVAADIKPMYREFTPRKTTTAEDFTRILNENRRHETREKALARAAARRERVAAARAEGQSFRSIADAEGVSVSTVHEDASTHEESGVRPRTPETVAGQDGKTYPAQKPKFLDAVQAIINAGHVSPKLMPRLEALTKNQQAVFVERMQMGWNPRKAIESAEGPAREPGDEESTADKYPKRKKRTPPGPREAVLDALGNPVPDRCRDAFADPQLGELIEEVEAVEEMLAPWQSWEKKAVKLADHYPFILVAKVGDHFAEALRRLQCGLDGLRAGVPHTTCPRCNGEQEKGKACRYCRGAGHVPAWRFEELQGAEA